MSERPRAARRAGTGARGLRAAAARAGARHILCPGAPRRSPPGRARGHGLRRARCGERGRSSALNPCAPAGPARRRRRRSQPAPDEPGRPGAPRTQKRSLRRRLCPVPLSSPLPVRLARGPRTASRRFRAKCQYVAQSMVTSRSKPNSPSHLRGESSRVFKCSCCDMLASG